MVRKILLFSTLSPYPFWAGSEKYWFDLVTDPRTRERFEFHIRLADSPVTRTKSEVLRSAGADVRFYKHHNVEFMRRNVARLRDRLTRTPVRTLPWYDEIGRGEWDLVWFNVDGFANLRELEYAVQICKGKNIPYWLMLQGGSEAFFLASVDDMRIYSEIALSAKRFVFIAERNRRSFERAIAAKLTNAFHSQNGLGAGELAEAITISKDHPVSTEGTARFFNLGRFASEYKGHHLVLEALSDNKWRGRDWKVSFIGVSGFGQEYLEKLTSYLGIAPERLKIVPFTEDVLTEIAKNDVLLMPSLMEGTPFAMIESMACGRPAVGTPIGGIPELIIEGETGWLSRTVDVADIADAMERMWARRDDWPTIGQRARQHVFVNNNTAMLFEKILIQLEADSRQCVSST